MTERFNIKRHDTSPSIRAILKDADDVAVDLTTALGVRFHMRLAGTTTAIVDAAAETITAASGIVAYHWQTGDTDTAGTYEAEFEVTLSDGSIETFPNNDYIVVRIIGDVA